MNNTKFIYGIILTAMSINMCMANTRILSDSIYQEDDIATENQVYLKDYTQLNIANKINATITIAQEEITPRNNSTSTTYLDFTKPVGVIPIQSNISPMGGLTYNIPIDAYPGVGISIPQISLSYNSMQENGIAGIGWSISGLSSITRGNKTIYYDGLTAGLSNIYDAFYLDGQRLIRQEKNGDSLYYQTVQGNIKVTATISDDNISNFKVFFPDGRIGEYSSSDSGNLSYPLRKMTDLDGNEISYSYSCDDNYHLIESIKYNSYAEIVFTYETRPDTTISFMNGHRIVSSMRLQKITCKWNYFTLHDYILTYSINNSLSMLSEVGLCRGGTSFNPLTFEYGNGELPESYTANTIFLDRAHTINNQTTNKVLNILRGKFKYLQSDGILSVPNRSPYILNVNEKHITNEYSEHENDVIVMAPDLEHQNSLVQTLYTGPNFVHVLCADLAGEQEDYIVKIYNSNEDGQDKLTFSVFRCTTVYGIGKLYDRSFYLGNVFCNDKGIQSLRPKTFHIGDFNGDGRQDIMVLVSPLHSEDSGVSYSCYIYNLENNSLLYRGTPFNYSPQIPYSNSSQNSFERMSNTERLSVIDYNGDGKSDICLINANSCTFYEFNTSGINITSCLFKKMTFNLTQNSLVNRELLFGDFNGDGLIDFLVTPKRNNSDKIWNVHYSKGNGEFESTSFSGIVFRKEDYYGFIIHDVNHDGKSDLINYSKNYFTTYLKADSVPYFKESCTNSISDYSAIVPINIVSHNNFSNILTLKDNNLTQYSFVNDIRKQKLLTAATNSLGICEYTTYKYPYENNSSYATNGSSDYPYVILKERIPFVCSSYEQVNGEIENERTYSFLNLTMHRLGMGICGMERIVSTGNRDYSAKDFNPRNFGVLMHDESNIHKTDYTYEIKKQNNTPIIQINTIKIQTKDKLRDFSSTTEYEYNEYGFPIVEEVESSDSIVSRTTTTVAHHQTGNRYLLNVVTEKDVTTTRNGMSHNIRVSHPSMSYNKPLESYSYINGNQECYETFTYDDNGFLEQKTIRNFDSPNTLITRLKYDPYGRISYLITPEQYTNYYSYNSLGQMESYTDKFGNTTSYEYDNFGRKVKTNYADGTWETIQYNWQNGSPTNYGALVNKAGYAVTMTYSNGNQTKDYYDTRQRLVESHQNIIGEYPLVVYSTYDTFGNLTTESVPVKSNANQRPSYVHTYDQLNRLIETVSPISQNVTTYAYNKNQITSVKDNITTTRVYDSQGNITSVIDPTGTTTYTYRPDGQMLSATVPCGLTTTIEYDNYGRRTKLIDPSAGTTTFTYNTSGYMASKTDGAGKQTLMEYDTFGRLTKKEYVGTLITTYSYNNKGLLTGEIDNNNAIRLYEYDQYGRLVWDYQSTNDIDKHNLTRNYDYAANGNLLSIEYSQEDGETPMFYGTERYEYNNGNIKKILFDAYPLGNNTFTIWDIESTDVYGNTENAKSGILSHYFEYNCMSLPEYVCTEKGEGDFPRELEYYYNNATGNLSLRYDFNRDIEEFFTYDHMNRLIGDGYNTFSYDNATGNMIFNSRLGNISYGQLQPSYRITAIDPLTGLGNTSSNYMATHRQTMTYNAMSRPETITENNHTIEFSYNGRGERVYSRFYEKDNTNPVLGTVITNLEQRYYLGNIYERHINEDGEEKIILYLGGNAYSAPAAFVMDEEYGPHMAYICRDNLGSITHVISDQYTKEYSYDAWGNLRDPDTYELYFPRSTQNSFFLGRGYTGHEHHGYFGLINMNARMYEPIMGRFISPDPFVQMPDNSQNFNRYTYCLNNPLRYTDESGEWFLVDDLFAIIVGGTINLTSNIIQGNISGDFGECFVKGFAAFSAGGVAGWGGLHPELGGWAWGGAVAGATNAWLGGATTAEGILLGGAMGIVSSGAGALGGHIGNQLGSVIINGTNITSPTLASTITGALGGFAGGYTGGLAVGLLATGDFSEANDMALDGALSGGVIGAATGFAGGIKYARDNKISPWTGEKTQNHHSFPKFLGGDNEQILTPMETSRHRTLHKELNEYLKTQTSDDKRYNMFPRKGNSGETIQNNFTDVTRINAAKTFYDSNKWRYWDARFDFYRNNKMIWKPW